MDANTRKKLFHIVRTALDRSENERDAYLDRVCESDAGLRAAAESMLADEAGSGKLISGELFEDALRSLAPCPKQLGSWRIIEPVGEGGMGAVYLAERTDGEFSQRAAIKVIRPGLASDDLLDRFRAERQILADLDHPGIARLLDGGATAAGVPWFAMEYIEGIPVDAWCDLRRASIRLRLALFVKICEAVHAAHQRLVVHRDIKPANVLVTDDGQPRLLDFGIAKPLDPDGGHSDLTRTRQGALTPRFASPEQILGRPVTTATDVHGLGLLLYRLLAGTEPFAGRPPLELARAIAEEIPPPPSEAVRRVEDPDSVAGMRDVRAPMLVRALRGDLDTITAMALRKDPHRRYPSARALADDIQNHLRRRPVNARPDSLSYRVGKFARRHRAAVAAGVLAVLALIGGFAGALWQAREADRQAELARAAAGQAEAVNEFLVDMLGAVDPNEAGREAQVADLIDRAAADVDTRLADRPEVAWSVHDTLQNSYSALGLYEAAADQSRAALELAGRVGDARQQAIARHNLAYALWNLGRYDQSGPLANEALNWFEANRPRTAMHANALSLVANLLEAENRYDEAEAIFRESLAIYRDLSDPASIARVANNLNVLLSSQGRPADAEPFALESLAILRDQVDGDDPDLAMALYNLGGLREAQGDSGGAEPWYRRGVEMSERVFGPEHPQSIMQRATLAGLLGDLGQMEEALTVSLSTVTRADAALPDTHPLTAYAHLMRGQVLLQADHPEGAEPHLSRALDIREAVLPEGHWLLWTVRSMLGDALSRQGRYMAAGPLLKQAAEALGADRNVDQRNALAATERLRRHEARVDGLRSPRPGSSTNRE